MVGMRRLPGSSLIEAIIASLIFLAVFVISLSTLTGLSLREDDGYTVLEAQRALTDCSAKYCDGTWAEGTYTDTFEWGEVATTISAYGDYDGVLLVILRLHIDGGRKTIEQRQLIVQGDE